MGSRRAQRTTILRAGIATLLLGTTLAVTGIAIAPASAYEPDPENHKIEICHATESGDNPYTTPSPAKWQITSPNGHGYLPDDGSHDADIIPPFPAGEHGGQSWPEYLGQNWTEENEAFYDAGCGEPESGPLTGDVTLAKVLAGGEAVPDPAPAGFDFTVECDSGTVVDPMPAIVPGAAAVTIADDVELDDTCTITETGVPLNAAVTFSTGEPGSDSTTVTVGSTNGVAVTATNTYTSGGGQTADVTLRKVLAGNAVPSQAPTGFDFTVSCDSGDVSDATPTVAADAAATTVATGVDVGDTCTITETTVLPAGASVGYDQGTPGTSSTTVTVDADGVAVVATNTYNSAGCTVDCGGPNPTAVLSASRSCATDGILIAVSNAGDAPGAVNILSGMDQPFSHGLNVLAGDSDEVLVPIAEDSDYLITVTDAVGTEVATFRGPKDCVTVGGIVVRPPAATPTPAPAVAPVEPTPVVEPVVARPVEVAGVVQTRELPRTGADSLPLAQLGAVLVLLGAAALVGSRRLELA